MHVLTRPSVAPMTQIWCYSLYGHNHAVYYEPVRNNIAAARENGATICVNTTAEFKDGVLSFFQNHIDEIIIVEHATISASRFPKVLRYLTPFACEAASYIYKDSDSIVLKKETRIINEWICDTSFDAIIIRDHPLHTAPILAGMFGARHRLALEIAKMARQTFGSANVEDYDSYSYDQQWLARDVYGKVRPRTLVRSSYLEYAGEALQPLERSGRNHIGAQAHRQAEDDVDDRTYAHLYGSGRLRVPFVRSFWRLYTKVRPTLFAAAAFTCASDLMSELRLKAGSEPNDRSNPR